MTDFQKLMAINSVGRFIGSVCAALADDEQDGVRLMSEYFPFANGIEPIGPLSKFGRDEQIELLLRTARCAVRAIHAVRPGRILEE
jgi:hypothetical protein